MSTHAAIIIESLGQARGIYCHFDGYPDTVGVMLRDHYSERSKVERLIALGDISYLAERVEPTGPHSYRAPEEGVTVAYGRDRGEDGIETKVGHDAKAVADKIDGQYVYVFGLDGKWTCDGKPMLVAKEDALVKEVAWLIEDQAPGEEWRDIANSVIAIVRNSTK